MTVRARKFDPKALISAPRRSAGVPNKDASYILYSVSTYSFEDHATKSEIRLMDAKSRESYVIDDSGKCSSPVWLEDDTIVVLRAKDDGSTELVIGNAKDFKNTCYLLGSIDASASGLKVVRLDSDNFGFAFVAPANPDESPHNTQKMPKQLSSGRVYRSTFVRHWDKYITPYRQAIWYGAILREPSRQPEASRRCYMTSIANALKGSQLESPIPPFGGVDHFDISKHGLAFVAKDITSDPALHTKCELYTTQLPFLKGAPTSPVKIPTPGLEGAKTSPAFSQDGKKLAVLVMKENGYEADRNRLLIIPDLQDSSNTAEMLESSDGNGRWNRSAAVVQWSHDGSSLLFTAENQGRSCLWALPTKPDNVTLPLQLTHEGSVGDFVSLEGGRIFVSSSSFVDNSQYAVLVPQSDTMSVQEISSASHSGSSLGLRKSQVSDIWFRGAHGNQSENNQVHAWVIKPSDFNPKKKYPLAMLVHGGPQGAWNDAWSTRWNAAVFAEQGYVVVSPNPTGSTGYGQLFTDAIQESYGDLPYHDIVKCFEYVEKHLDYVDTERAVALGASYGGYMMNWIQGQPLGRRFKALVTHDGIFSTAFMLATEELYFVNHDFGGPWSKNRDKWLKFDPAQFTENWQTPHLIVHSDLDYRIAVSEGLAAFNVLQSQGVESEFLNFPDENHFVLKPENSLVWHRTVLNFINRHVGLSSYDIDGEKEVLQGNELINA